MNSLNKQNAPNQEVFSYPEKALFFGTGVLLRGLPLYFIDKANKQGVFKGRVVVVKSTSRGDISAYSDQDGCFTTVVRGIANGKEVEENIINCAISRVLTASDEWDEILTVAQSPDLTVVVSNTTEVGITYEEESIFGNPPSSFPAKLLAILHKRYEAFGGDTQKGLIVVPTELISENGKMLHGIVNQLAAYNRLDVAFVSWLNEANRFCNSLVDRIVPGEITGDLKTELEAEFGYRDDLMLMAEPYRLWAIEGDGSIKSKLSFHEVDAGVKIESSIEKYKELKLRLLNAPHTFCTGLAHLAGFVTVKEAMSDEAFLEFIRGLMFDEIAKSLDPNIDASEIDAFAEAVIDRFSNTHLDHKWLSISLNYTSKIKMRCVKLIESWYAKSPTERSHMAFGFASYLRFMKVVRAENGKYYGHANGQDYVLNDPEAEQLMTFWNSTDDVPTLVGNILQAEELWETDLSKLEGFQDDVTAFLNDIMESPQFGLDLFNQTVRE